MTFVLWMLLNKGKYVTSIIQNATYTGAIMIAASCDMYSFPYPSLIIGCLAGAITTLTLHFFPKFMYRIKYYDTRGILYIHAFPGLFAAIISSITTATLAGN